MIVLPFRMILHTQRTLRTYKILSLLLATSITERDDVHVVDLQLGLTNMPPDREPPRLGSFPICASGFYVRRAFRMVFDCSGTGRFLVISSLEPTKESRLALCDVQVSGM